MKKLLLGSLALATFALSSCTDENEAMLNSINEVFSGEIVSSGSRTTMGDNGSVVWSDGDAINLFKKTGYYQKYMVKNGGSTSADFVYANEGYKGATLDKNYAVYPYNANNTINGTTISVDLSTLAAQDYTENSFQNGKALMVAKSENTTLQFSNTLAVLRFDLSMGGPIMDATIESIKISSTTGRALTGNATIDMSQAEKQPAVIADNGGTEITLIADVALSETAATPFYVMFPAGEYDKDELKVEIAAVINGESTVAKFKLPAVNIPRSVITTFTKTFDTEENGDWKGTTDENYTSFNEEQLREVFANGGSCALTGDLELEQPLTLANGKDVVLDLNGFTLKYASSLSGNQDMMLVKGNLTVKNGSIEYVYTGANQGWNAMTTIFNITAGGVVNLEGVTAKNLGGSDMAFVAHLNNWGEATLSVENSTLESTYIAVRAFNSGNDMNNVTIKNSTLKGKFCFWVHNYIGAGDSAGTDATLNVNIFGNNNIFDYTGKAPILYGFNNPIYYSENGVEAVTSLSQLQAKISDTSVDYIYLAADVEGTITVKRKVTIESVNPKNKAIIKGRVNIANANPTFKNIIFDRNETDSNAEWDTANGSSNCLQYKAVVMIYGNQSNKITFNACDFLNNMGTHKSAITSTACDLVIDKCYFEGRSSAIYAQTNLSITNSTFNYTGTNNVIASLNGVGNDGGKFIFTGNEIIGDQIYVLAQFLSTTGFGNGTYHFNVQNNTGAGFENLFFNTSRVANKTFAEGSATF